MTLEVLTKVPEQGAFLPTEYEGRIMRFEGVEIQWGKGEWKFQHPELGLVKKPTFSLLNPEHWGEIADLLKQGKTAAGMMAGVYGVFKRLDRKDTNSADALFDHVKKRPRSQKFVALVHPKDIMGFVDRNRLKEPYKKQLRREKERLRFYAGPQHVILPVRENKVHSALVNEHDQTIACFWVPDHFGFEGLVNKARKRIGGKGLLGGGSLNIHGQEPSYDRESLYRAMAGQEEWLKKIDFIIIDDIAEAGAIERSHTMTRYVDEFPEIVRIGSLSPEKVRRATGHDLRLAEGVKYASSKPPYSPEQDAIIDARVEEVLQRVQRFGNWIRVQRLI